VIHEEKKARLFIVFAALVETQIDGVEMGQSVPRIDGKLPRFYLALKRLMFHSRILAQKDQNQHRRVGLSCNACMREKVRERKVKGRAGGGKTM
jgi:hypothetical protein